MVASVDFESLDGVDRADPAEVARRDDRQQVQAKVGGRRAVRQHRPRLLLEVVRRQHVVRGRDERVEVAPRAAGDEAQRPGIDVRDGLRFGDRDGWLTQKATSGDSIHDRANGTASERGS